MKLFKTLALCLSLSKNFVPSLFHPLAMKSTQKNNCHVIDIVVDFRIFWVIFNYLFLSLSNFLSLRYERIKGFTATKKEAVISRFYLLE